MTLTKTFKTTPVFDWNYNAPQRIVINQGGTSSGKTYAILQVLFLRLIDRQRIATVVGQDIPNLKKGAIRDFEERILVEMPWFTQFIENHNKTDRFWRLTNGSILEFTSFSDPQDAKNGKRDLLFVNEANGINYEVYNQLAMRTSEQIFIDYNPTTRFWVHDRLIGNADTVVFYSNFTHNPFCDDEVIGHIRSYKTRDPESWRVYGLGKTGNVKGLVFRSVNYVPQLPKHLKKTCYGLDFGFTNDPTALVYLGEQGGEIWGKELIYKLGMTNQAISRELDNLGVRKTDTIYADSAEPKSIAELKAEGWNVKPAEKGRDSVVYGIDLMKKYAWNITSDSTNWKQEQSNYKWEEKDGIPINKPVDNFNHCWDAARYAIMMKWGKSVGRLPQMI